MPNMSSSRLSPDQRRFVDEWAALLAPWTLPQQAGRTYAYLLLCPKPASLDDIVRDLEISKGNASVAARLLEKHGMAIRHSVPGSKRALYSAPSNHAGLILKHAELLGAMARMLQSVAPTVEKDEVAERLSEISEFFIQMRDTFEGSVTAYEHSRGQRRVSAAE
jgi:DNA-binding transcriptional regulator GbsR (MarR family)